MVTDCKPSNRCLRSQKPMRFNKVVQYRTGVALARKASVSLVYCDARARWCRRHNFYFESTLKLFTQELQYAFAVSMYRP